MNSPEPATTKPVIGLMGAPGSGKSLVASILAELGCGIVDADHIARDTIEHPEVRQQLRNWWGGSVIHPDGTVNRKAVGGIVFKDPAQRTRLEALVHPRVHAERWRLRSDYMRNLDIKAIVEDCPLLLEVGLDTECDTLVFVDSPKEHRERRVTETRGWSPEELADRESSQLPLDIKRDRADYVINNDADPDQLRVQSSRVLSLILHQTPSR
ncbi:MAG: dephospho-CoA kinase [Phycisphaeraceae bacterium]